MQSVSSLTYPGSRSLAGWWRLLQPHRPAALWVGYIYVHRVEAPVAVAETTPLEPLTRLLLRALCLGGEGCANGSECLPRLQERLHLPAAVLHQMLLGLDRSGLAQLSAGGWHPTEKGREAVQRGEAVVLHPRRYVFPFVERFSHEGATGHPPRYVPLAECTGAPWSCDGAPFDTSLLAASLAQDPEWKKRHGFPADIHRAPALESWQQVIVDRPQRVFLVMARVNDELLGFAVDTGSWTLGEAPCLRLQRDVAYEVWPELADEPPLALAQAVWDTWCRQRGIPDSGACRLSFRGDHLEVAAPDRLVHRLRSAKSDILKGEAWVLLGEGHLRSALALRLRLPVESARQP